MREWPGRFLLATMLLIALSAQPALADSTLRVLIDLDNNLLTGCDAAVSGGTFSGAEILILTTIDDSTGTVTGVSRQICDVRASPASFGPQISQSPGGWSLGSDLGVAGSDVIESFVPLNIVRSSFDRIVRLGFSIEEVGAPGSGDAILVAGGEPLEVFVAGLGIADIPTMTFWGSLAFSLLLALTAFFVLRRHPGSPLIAVLAAGLAVSGIGLAWAAIVMDGDPSDWNGIPPLAVEMPPETNSPDLIAVFATVMDDRFSLRADAFFDEPPVAEDDDDGGAAAYATLIDTPLTVPDSLTDPVERNDFAGKPVGSIVSFGGALLGGAVTDNASGATVAPLPQGGGSLTLNTDGSFNFTPPTGFIGNYRFQYRLGNGEGDSDATVTIAVQQAPTAADDAYSTDPGSPISRSTAAADDLLDNDTLRFPPATLVSFGGGSLPGDATTYAAGSTVTVGADGSLNVSGDGGFSFTPETGSTSTFTFEYLLQNDAGSDTATVAIDIREPPAITSNGGGPTAGLSVEENLTAVTDVQATDPEGETEGAGLTYGLTGGTDQALFSIDADTGGLTFVSSRDFENPGDANTDNIYEVQVTVTDSTGFSDLQDISVSITDVNDAPSITSNGGGAAATVRIAGDTGAVTDVQSIDQDGETEGAGLTYSITGGADQTWFSIDAVTGELTIGGGRARFSSPADADLDAVYEVQVTVTDTGGLSGTQEISVTYIQLSIGNRVWQDSNNDQFQNPGEAGIDGVQLHLFQFPSPTGVYRSTVTVSDSQTQEAGYYIFDDLPEGDYIVEIAAKNFVNQWHDGNPSNGIEGILYNSVVGGPYFSSEDTDLSHLNDNGVDLNDNGIDENDPATNGIRSVVINLEVNTEASPSNPPDDLDLNTDTGEGGSGELDGDADMTVDFGIYVPVMSLGNRVFFDDDGNRQLDTPDIAGIRSPQIELVPGDETVADTDKGPEGDGEPDIWDSNSNLTVDFGFFIP